MTLPSTLPRIHAQSSPSITCKITSRKGQAPTSSPKHGRPVAGRGDDSAEAQGDQRGCTQAIGQQHHDG